MSHKDVLSVRFDPEQIRELRRLAEERSLSLSDLLREAALHAVRSAQQPKVEARKPQPTLVQKEIALTIHSLRALRDQMDEIPCIQYFCGNISLSYNHGHCPRGCGTPSTMWSRDAWDLELAARKLEDQWQVAS